MQLADGEASILEVNRAFATLVDRPRRALIGSDPAELLAGAGDPRRLLSEPTGQLGVDGYVVVSGDERVPVTLRVALIEAVEGVPQLVVVQASELVRRRQMERALRESEQRVRDLVDNVDALIYIKSADGRYLLINRHFEEVFGVRRDDPGVRTNYDIVSPETAAVYTANDRRVLETGIPSISRSRSPRATAAPGCRSSSRSSTRTDGPTPSRGSRPTSPSARPPRPPCARPRRRPSARIAPRASSSRA